MDYCEQKQTPELVGTVETGELLTFNHVDRDTQWLEKFQPLNRFNMAAPHNRSSWAWCWNSTWGPRGSWPVELLIEEWRAEAQL